MVVTLLSDVPFLPAVGVEVRVGGEGLEAQEGEVGQPSLIRL